MSVSRYFTIHRFPACISILTVSYLTVVPSTLAQVSSDGTVNTQVTPTGNQLEITGGTQQGNNLFHSFNQFSIPDKVEAYFNNSNQINNIISRVTGASISQIEGIIRANGTANLFLINPNGITFGPNAQVNIGGSFLASSAESIEFADGVQFSATNTQPNPLLTMSVPVGLQFGSNPGNILLDRVIDLSVNPGNTLAFVGGNIHFIGAGNEENEAEGINVTNGRIELGSVGSKSTVQITKTNSGFKLGYEGVNNFQDILFSQGFEIIRGFNSSIQLQGRRISLDNNAQIFSRPQDSQTAGDITVNATESVEMTGSKTQDFLTGLFAEVGSGVTGSGGNIIINTQKLILRDGALVASEVFGAGQGGNVEINASDSVDVIGTGFLTNSTISTTTVGSGNGGDININAKNLGLQDGGLISAATAVLRGDPPNTATGKGGTVNINASESVQITGTEIIPNRIEAGRVPSAIFIESGFSDIRFLGFGQGGSLNLNTDRLMVANGGVLSAASLGEGTAGNINIQANTILLDQGVLTASSQGTGNAGNLTIKTDKLTVNNHSRVAVRSIGLGQGGNLTLNAGSIVVDNNSQLTATSQPLTPENVQELVRLGIAPELLEVDNTLANAGSLNIITDNLTVNNDSEVTVSSFGLGNAGNINIKAQNILLDNDSRLTAETASGEGGNIALDVNQLLILRHDSQISTTAGTQQGSGNGGNIDINARFIIAVPAENSDIFANAFLGQGGNIDITTSGVFGIEERAKLTPLSDITASSQFGQLGTVAINRPDVDPQRSLVKLPADVVDAKKLIIDACSPGGALTRGEFIIRGRGGLYPNPHEGVNTQTGLTELGYPNNTLSNFEPSSEVHNNRSSSPEPLNQRETHRPPIVEAQGWITDADGKVVLTAQASAVTPHSSGFMPATCYDLSTTNQSPSP
ncbi:S-layer family protein [Crocosphaera sp. UHCC 0190]|uniref:S-layer family protein n=1 Tax=Crocosphaera sp. UHCC 0190 TaxID=3110246 RepID=UPI002B206ED4|nr:S-layer family protein [Crocosphaera sp. UHCC 0190]MEA5510232.1 S-layer family protein [Crocosphaera sp. UHCC 0190]